LAVSLKTSIFWHNYSTDYNHDIGGCGAAHRGQRYLFNRIRHFFAAPAEKARQEQKKRIFPYKIIVCALESAQARTYAQPCVHCQLKPQDINYG